MKPQKKEGAATSQKSRKRKGEKLGGRVAKRSKMLIPTENIDATELHKITNGLINDAVGLIAKTDRLIVDLAKREMGKCEDEDKRGHLRNKMRELARLKIELRKSSGNANESLDDYLHPTKMRMIIEGVKPLCGYNTNTKCSKHHHWPKSWDSA